MPINSPDELIAKAQALTKAYGKVWHAGLGRIIRLWAGPPLEFPVRRRGTVVSTIGDVDEEYLMYYIKRYYRERERAIIMQPVATQPDPVVNVVLRAFERVPPDDLHRISLAHRISMQAENIVGKLLERYVATILEPKGWVWCAGETVRNVDFMTNESTPRLKLLQIKNRSNSENSASSSVRAGTKIEKWFRINSMTGQTYWTSLPENQDGGCSEEGFYEFVNVEAERQRPVEEVPLEEVVAEEIAAEGVLSFPFSQTQTLLV